MPYRSFSLFVALSGSVLVLALILLGRDLHKAARTGPGWKRKLVAAGLVLLGLLGFTPGCDQVAGPGSGSSISGTNPADPIPPGQALDDTAQWKQLVGVWREAGEIASGKRGDYPFDQEGRKKVLDDLATAAANLDALEKAGLLSGPEAGLLGKDLALLTSGVQAKRPTEMRMATCYDLMPFTAAQDALKRLADRLPLLEKLAESDTLQPQVVSKVLATVERDLAVLDKEQMRDQLPQDAKAQAEKVSRAAKSAVQKIKKRLSGAGTLDQSSPWKQLSGAWRVAGEIASGKRGDYPFDEKGKKKVLDDLATAATNLGALEKAGLLSATEAGLLGKDLAQLTSNVQAKRPTEMRMATCYSPVPFTVPQDALKRLADRLPLLEKLAESDTLHPQVVSKVLESIQRDLDVLAKKQMRDRLSEDAKDQAKDVSRAARSAIQKIKKKLEGSE